MSGCQESIRDRLVGEWVGQPDTAAAAAERVAKRQESQDSEKATGNGMPVQDATNKLEQTDLEGHEVTIRLQFKGDKTVHMSLGDNSEPREGHWRVLTLLPPDGAEIEITLDASEASEADDQTATKKAGEKRRFIVDFQQDGEKPGFTLVEKNSDPKFGRLYFEKKQ
ncbi:hypothetical protein Pan181_11400 [Aeoliella mucimassa]|uniref:Uncharacterized protein n=2 Tax=Aeoliella mucimassa TaxID=2527972 RepID=A0A518AJR2_9BACT|nr:hypothetical protein Pan181_11400 [Aeoliella mucimassa]